MQKLIALALFFITAFILSSCSGGAANKGTAVSYTDSSCYSNSKQTTCSNGQCTTTENSSTACS